MKNVKWYMAAIRYFDFRIAKSDFYNTFISVILRLRTTNFRLKTFHCLLK